MTNVFPLAPAASGISPAALTRVAELAGSVDCDPTADRRPVLRSLAEEGVLDLGLPGSNGGYVDQTRVLSELAGVCMSTAFSAWAHRMTVEYLALFGNGKLIEISDSVRSGYRPGSTAMASTFRAASGQADLTIDLADDHSGNPTSDTSTLETSNNLTATGTIAWASNLYPDAIIVTGMRHGSQRRIVAFEASRSGVSVSASEGLLALDASKSGSVSLNNVPIDDADVLDIDFKLFVQTVRPVFLTFQTSFCLGLAAASLSSIGELSGVGAALSAPLAERRTELARLSQQLESLAHWLDHRNDDPPVHILRLRLEAAHLATAATQLELAIRGGQAYQAKSPTARRVREALFLPVQSPTEAQLQWELQHSV